MDKLFPNSRKFWDAFFCRFAFSYLSYYHGHKKRGPLLTHWNFRLFLCSFQMYSYFLCITIYEHYFLFSGLAHIFIPVKKYTLFSGALAFFNKSYSGTVWIWGGIVFHLPPLAHVFEYCQLFTPFFISGYTPTFTQDAISLKQHQ